MWVLGRTCPFPSYTSTATHTISHADPHFLLVKGVEAFGVLSQPNNLQNVGVVCYLWKHTETSYAIFGHDQRMARERTLKDAFASTSGNRFTGTGRESVCREGITSILPPTTPVPVSRTFVVALAPERRSTTNRLHAY